MFLFYFFLIPSKAFFGGAKRENKPHWAKRKFSKRRKFFKSWSIKKGGLLTGGFGLAHFREINV
jgi:hypothetical protein